MKQDKSDLVLHLPPHPSARYLLAVSGGIDSMVMADLFLKAGIGFEVAHMNFGLRGESSDKDEALVRSWCQKHQKIVHVRKGTMYSGENEERSSVQERARTLRYRFFQECCMERNLQFVATAHQANDQIETVLFHFFRGTGIKGLQGIPYRNGIIVRPVLHIMRRHIEQYALEHQIAYRDDESNATTKYTRNKIRHQLIPVLSEIIPSWEQNMLLNLQRFQDAARLYQCEVDRNLKHILIPHGRHYRIPIGKLKKIPAAATVLYEALHSFGFVFEQCKRLLDMIGSQSGTYIESHSWMITRNRAHFILSERNSIESDYILIEKGTETIHAGQSQFSFKHIREIPDPWPSGNDSIYIDESQLEFPLTLRRWKEGDYFYPLGLNKKKKLSRLFIDLKWSQPEKEECWILESNQRIVWVAGVRADHRFRVTPQTKSIVRIKVRKTDPPA